jgi:hypothetical protein
MKGVLFAAVEDLVVGEYGPDTWDDLLDAAGVDGVWTTLGTYPSEQLSALVEAAAPVLGLDVAATWRLMGRGAFGGLARRHPELVEHYGGCGPLLDDLNHIIHPEVMKLYPEARPPEFGIGHHDDGTTTLEYRSTRELGQLAVGLVLGAADHFGETVEVLAVADTGECCTIDFRVTGAASS